MRARKSSACVTLVLMGAALSGCGQDEGGTLRRDQYASRADCLADWGDPADCEERPAGAGGVTGGRTWWGPSYYGRSGAGSGGALPLRPGSHAITSHSISRGGFGASGQAHASGGS
jgi:hypothetical protein